MIKEFTSPDIEDKRLSALNSYNVLDTLPEKEYDAITRLASYICQVPIALISLIDEDRQWFKSKFGLDTGETPRADAFCHYTILDDKILEVNNALEDDTFKDNRLVTGAPDIRFYAGAPLIDPEGHRLGSLCVIDRVPRKLTDEQKDALRTLADEVMSHMLLSKQKKELEASLVVHKDFFRLFNSSPEIHLIADRDSNIELVNDAIENVLGYTPQQAIGKSLWWFVVGNNREQFVPIIEKAITSKQAFEIETETVTADKQVKWIGWCAITKEGKWYASGRDITYQKKLVADLEQLSLVASSTTSGVVINNKNGEVEWVNKAFEKITGYNLSDVAGKHLGDSLKGELTDVSIIERARRLSKNKESFEVDLLAYRKDGQSLWISVINSVILGANGEVDKYIEVIIDITAKKKVELELISAKEEAVQLNRAKDMFISVMSHEIRTPLNAVIGMSNILIENDPPESQKENLDILKFSAENLMTLINDVLDFTKIETGNIELEKANVNLREMVQRIVNSMQYKAVEKNIYLKGTVDNTLPEFVLADSARLIQVLLNITGNAIKFTDNGGVTIDLKVLEESNTNIRVKFSVTDSGIGIANDKLATIFESFKQAEADTTRKYGGTGLGLAISKRLVELYDSRINVESVQGKGSTFWFIITFNKANGYINSSNNTMEIGLRLNVLVVDDNQINRILVNKVLQKWGVKVDFAENGQEAIAKVEANLDYDVVLMDVHMPVMGGLEATRIIRAKTDSYFQQLPILALTASMLSSEITQMHQAGMNDFILKPFEPKSLFDKLSKYQKQ